MLVRRLTSLAILVAFIGLAVLSFAGDRVLGSIFIVAAGAVLTHHAVRLCPRCSNEACAFNPRFGRARQDTTFSDLRINRSTVIPLLLTGPLAVIAAWRFSPYLTFGLAAFALSAHFVFREQTCRHCGNQCVGNCNPAYREAKHPLAHG